MEAKTHKHEIRQGRETYYISKIKKQKQKGSN